MAQSKPLWSGRLNALARCADSLNSSIRIDSRMFRQDIKGSVAHVEMLCKIGVVSQDECRAIVNALEKILAEIDSGSLEIDGASEDIHTFVEQELTRRVGDAGKKLHTARSRNDQVALDLRMFLADEISTLVEKTKSVIRTLCAISSENLDTIMPGYTHLQRAQPITLAHHLMAYAQMLLRDIDRLCDCQKRTKISPLGAGALAGTTYPIDRQFVAERVGFAGVTQNSLDSVSDRDFCLELSSCLCILMMHLSRFAEDMILWCSLEFRFMTLADEFSTGSSIMPQKKNPDLAELIRGKSGRVFGNNIALLTMMKGLPMSYNKDMQEDKEAIFDSIDTVALCLDVLPPMLETAKFHRENMLKAAREGFINATDCADWLVKKGLPFREAYKITGELVSYCIEHGFTLENLPLDEYKKISPLFDEGVYKAIDLYECLKSRNIEGAPARASEQIENVLKML